MVPSLTNVKNYSPASKVSRDVANLTERKNPHTLVYGVKEFVHLSVCDKLFSQLSPDRLNRMGQKKFRTSMAKFHDSKFLICLKSGR